MRKLLAFLLFALATVAQPTMMLTPSRIGDTSTAGTLKYNAQHNSYEWAQLRSTDQMGCNSMVAYQSNTPDHLPPVYASMESNSDGTITNWVRVGTDGYDDNGIAAYGRGLSLGSCYLTLKDGDVTPSGWSTTPGSCTVAWNSSSVCLTPKDYGILAGMQAVKILNKATPTMAKIAWVSRPSPDHYGGLDWMPVSGMYNGKMDRNIGTGQDIFGSIDVLAYDDPTTAQTNSGAAVLYFSNTASLTVGDYVIAANIPAGTTFTSITPNTGVVNTSGSTVTWVSGSTFDSLWVGWTIIIDGYSYTISTVPNSHSLTVSSGIGTKNGVAFSTYTYVGISANATGNIVTGSLITDQPPVSGCSAGQGRVFWGEEGVWPITHTGFVFSNIAGPLGTVMNGNTYYVSAYSTTWHGLNSTNYGYYLDTDSGGTTPLCAVPSQATDYRGNVVGSGQNYNDDPQFDDEYPPRAFMPMIAVLYDWLHPQINQSIATALNGLASQLSTSVKATLTAGGSTWNVSTNPWTDSTLSATGNYPQAIPTAYSTLQAQSLDAMDEWTRELIMGWTTTHDNATLGPTTSNYHWGEYAGFGLIGIAAYNDDARGPVWYDFWRNHMHMAIDQPYAARWLGPQSNMMDAYRYAGFANLGVAMTLISNITAMGEDLTSNSAQPFPWILGLEFRKHALEPNGKSYITRGTVLASSTNPIPPCVSCPTAEALFPVQYLADLVNDPLKNKFRSFVQGQITNLGEVDPAGTPAPAFMFWDPTATQIAWNDEPTVLGNMANPAGGYGHVFMRSDWTSGGVYASFEARPLIFDWGNGKDFLDNAGSILLQRGNNTLLVNMAAECVRDYPASWDSGTGAALEAAADNCSNNGVWDNQHARQPIYTVMNTAGNPSTTTSVDSVTLTTNADTPSGAILHFADTTGITTGMVAIGTHIPSNPYFTSYVLAVTPTTVTLNANVSGDVPTSTPIVFATVGSHDGGANAGGQWWAMPLWRNETYSGPGEFGDGPGHPPLCFGPGTPWTAGEAYTVTTGGNGHTAFTVTLAAPMTDGWGNGTPLIFTWATGATPPSYYLSGGSGTTESIIRGTLYLIVNWSSNGTTATFGIVKAPTNRALNVDYPTTGTPFILATAGSGTQKIQGGGCNINSTAGLDESHPARVDLLESMTNYAYARGVGLEADYSQIPDGTHGGRVAGYQREVLYLLPKLFLVYDRTRQRHMNAQAVNFTSLTDTDGTNPVIVYVSGQHSFHSGMQVKITGAGCSSLYIYNQTYTITALDPYRFSLNGALTTIGAGCAGTATGNIWGRQVVSWHTAAKPTEVTTGGQATAGMRQWYVERPAVNVASIANTTPVSVTTSTPHYLNTGMTTIIAGQSGGCAGLNGVWTVTASTYMTFTLNGSTACGTSSTGTSTKFNGAITTVKPLTPPVFLEDGFLQRASQTSGSGLVYRLEVYDPRDCTSNASWCTPTSPDTVDTQQWLTVFDTSQSPSDTATITPLTATNADMVQVSSTAVAGFQNSAIGAGNCSNYTCTPPAPTLPISYSFTQPSGVASHVIAGMTPSTTYYITAAAGSVTIAATGSSGAVTATPNGILAFSSSGGGAAPRSAVMGPVKIAGPVRIQ